MVNEKRAATVQVACVCGGRTGCTKCEGDGMVEKIACRFCGGTGKAGGRCPDCRGLGWRDMDNSREFM